MAAVSQLIGQGIGFSPGSVKYIIGDGIGGTPMFDGTLIIYLAGRNAPVIAGAGRNAPGMAYAAQNAPSIKLTGSS